jgi:Cellulase (glycosyl hydrolase family 5)
MSLMTETRRRRARRLFAVGALACAVLPAAPALAAPDQQSLIEDEKLMLESGPAVQASSLDEAKALGADVIRANVIWSRYAPSPTSTKKPKGFDGRNPAAYPAGVFGMLDSFIAGAQARGMSVVLTPTGPIPAWASGCKGSAKARSTCKPNAKLFGDFVRALGAKYPSVKAWSIWNEPNLRAWLTPQYEVSKGQAIQRSAYMYRQLARSAIAGLKASGHTTATDQIWLGETAPLGDDPSGCSAQRKLRAPSRCAKSITKTSPSTFLRGVFCLSTSGGSLRGTEGKDQHCSGYKRLAVNGYAHHPYTRGGSRPPLSKTNAGEITISTASRLTKLLDQAGRRKRIPARLPVHYTEHGWQTNPPGVHDAFAVTDAQQAEYINQSDWIAYNNSRVHTVAQYKIVDDESIATGFQMGLRLFSGGARKPSYDAYKLPLWVVGKGSNVTVYGQIRPADAGAAGNVEVQNATSAGGAYKTVATVPVTSANGIFTTSLPNSGGVWRLRWNGLTSRQAEVAAK